MFWKRRKSDRVFSAFRPDAWPVRVVFRFEMETPRLVARGLRGAFLFFLSISPYIFPAHSFRLRPRDDSTIVYQGQNFLSFTALTLSCHYQLVWVKMIPKPLDGSKPCLSFFSLDTTYTI